MGLDKNKTSLTQAELKDKIQGVIFGAAIGDGLGLATEFMPKEQAKTLYGNGPIKFGNSPGHEFWRDACRSGWFENDFTDDTDQMLLILQSLLANDGYLNPVNFAYRLKEWSRIGFPELDNKLPNGMGFTVRSSSLHKEFLSNPFRASYEVWDRNNRNLAANGAVMRTGVLGVPYFWDERRVVENSIFGAKVTHTDPRSVSSAVIASVIISRLLRGSTKPPKKEDGEEDEDDDYESSLTEMVEFGSTSDNSYLEKFKGEGRASPKEIPTSLHHSLLREVRRLAARIRGEPMNPYFEHDFSIPQHKPVDVKRFEHPPPLRPNVKSVDEYGADPEMMKLCKEVVHKYKFLVKKNSLCPCPPPPQSEGSGEAKVTSEGGNGGGGRDEAKATASEEANWEDQLHAHCFPDFLSSLKLNERNKIGYTLKCLGAGLYLGTRRKPENMTSPEFFENLVTQLALEGGDADTNCAVAGAILGCRLGKSGLPKEWVEGLRHHDFLEKISDNLFKMVLKSMKKEKD